MEIKHNTKRRIGREFLYLLGTSILLLIITFFGAYKENQVRNEYSELDSELSMIETIDSLPYRLRMVYLINELVDANSDELVDRKATIRDIKQSPEQTIKWYNYILSLDKRVSDVGKIKFTELVTEDTHSERYLSNIEEVEKRKKEKKDSIFYHWHGYEIGVVASILFMVFFLLRYLLYCTLWSIRLVKSEKDES